MSENRGCQQGIRDEFGVPCAYLGLYAFGTHKLWNNYEGFYCWDAPAYIQRFVAPDHMLVCWPWRGMALLFCEAIAGLIRYKEWQANPLAGIHQYWFLDQTNQRRLRGAIAQRDEEGTRVEMRPEAEQFGSVETRPGCPQTATDAIAQLQGSSG
jgi:hypothetical protein